MILTERIEMMIIGIFGIVLIIGALGVFYGNNAMINIIDVILGVLGGYLGNQAKTQYLAANQIESTEDEAGP